MKNEGQKILNVFLITILIIISSPLVAASLESNVSYEGSSGNDLFEDTFSGIFLGIVLILMFVMLFVMVILPSLNRLNRRRNYITNREYEGSGGSNYSRTLDQIEKLRSKSYQKNKYRTFCGVEIECYRGEDFSLSDFPFKKVSDGSLGSGGREFVSEPMNGDKLFNKIDEICKKLKEKRYYVDNSCGLHIHIGIQEKLDLIKKLYLFYAKYEDYFFKMLPKSRQNRHYCEKIKNTDKFSLVDVKEIKDMNTFKKMYYETNYYSGDMDSRYYNKRYCWTNFHSIFFRGTLEIRSHSGTINSEKIKRWIKIHLRVLEFVKKKTIEEIYNLKVQKNKFLELFDKDTQNYIESRWGKFKSKEENYSVPNSIPKKN